MADRLASKLLNMILENPKTRHLKRQSIKNGISQIHKRNPRITLNAAAHLFAERHGFSLFRSLGSTDRESLGFIPSSSGEQPTSTKTVRTLRGNEIQPDFESPFIKEANDNTKPYAYIYVLENGLRQVILDKFQPKGDWWNDEKATPKEVRDYAKRIEDAERKYPWLGPRGKHPIYYVGLHELFRIIENGWRADFREIFPHLEDLRTWVRESIPIRNLVAHNVKTRVQDRQNIKIRTDYICRLIENWNKKRNP